MSEYPQMTKSGASRTNVQKCKKKLVIVGDGGTGKTLLLIVYVNDKLTKACIPTDCQKYVSKIRVNKFEVSLELWDSPGDDYAKLRPSFYPDVDVVLFCFSFDDRNSFDNILSKWRPGVGHFCPDAAYVLVGNKCDLQNDEATINYLKSANMKPITDEEALEMAKDIGAYAYVRCSAKTDEGVRRVFETAVRAAIQQKSILESCCQLM